MKILIKNSPKITNNTLVLPWGLKLLQNLATKKQKTTTINPIITYLGIQILYIKIENTTIVHILSIKPPKSLINCDTINWMSY